MARGLWRGLWPLAVLVPTAGATCEAGVPILHCLANDGAKEIALCLEGDRVRYSFGTPGAAPDLTLSETVAEVKHQPWNGVGRSIWEATRLFNKGYVYEVFLSVDRLDEDHPISAGVTVLRDDETLATIACDPGAATISLFEMLDAKAAQGLCWDQGAVEWGACVE